MDIEIRPACPDDASFLGWVMLMADRSHLQRGIWDRLIGRSEKECLAFLGRLAVTDELHMCHYKGFLVAEVSGHPVGAVSGYDPVALPEVTVGPAMAVVMERMGLTPEDMTSGQKSLAAYLTCHPEPCEGAWIVEHVATRPGFRRQGIILRLLEEILKAGRQRGFRLAQVSFAIGNTAAQHAYEKAGFRFLDEKRHHDFEAEMGCPGIARLLRDL